MLEEKAIRALKENAVFTELEHKPGRYWSAGEGMAWRAWRGSVYKKQTELELDDRLLEEEVHDFIATLRRAGIKSFVFSDNEAYVGWLRGEIPWWDRLDRGIAEHLQDFEAEGCRIGRPCIIERNLVCEERVGAGIRIWL